MEKATCLNVTVASQDDATSVHLIAARDVVDVLVRFCLEQNIPIPRMGAKSVCILRSGIALLITMGSIQE